MAKLPGELELGPIPTAAPARPVGSYDVSGFARGGQALAQGAQQLGKGVATAGEGVGGYTLDANRWDYAKAHSDFLSRKIDLTADLAEDRNYAADDAGKTMPQRYGDRLKDLQARSAELITDPRTRERFMFSTQPQVEEGLKTAESHARGLENDANTAYVEEQGPNFAGKAVAATDDNTRAQIIDTYHELINGLVAKGARTQTQALAMKQAWAQQYATTDVLAARNSGDPQRIQIALNRLSRPPGTPDDIIDRIIHTESNGDPYARAKTSSAYGVAQFLESRPGGDQTWLQLLQQHRPDLVQGRSLAEVNALRADPTLAREMLGHLVETNRGILEKNGIAATPGSIYLSHFLGPAGAVAVLKADPNTPVAEALAKAVGPGMARQMVEANGSVLGGRLAGSVTQWADRKMGGAGDGHIYDVLNGNPVLRERLKGELMGALHATEVSDGAAFSQRVQDTTAEAFTSGTATNPLGQHDFISRYGATEGPQRYKDYQGDLQLGVDMQAIAGMSVAQQHKLLEEDYRPEPGPGMAAGVQRQAKLAEAVKRIDTERQADPARFAIARLPAVTDAWNKFAAAQSDPTQAAALPGLAREYAMKTTAEQRRVGVPDDMIAIAPKAWVESFNKTVSTATDSDDPQKRIGLVAQIQREAGMWGDNWPAVMRQMAPTAQPVVRAIAAGADPVAMTRLLSLGKDESPAKLLKEQNETKFKDVSTALNTEMAPFLGSLVGRQRDRDYAGYYGLGEKLAALYVRDGDDASTAAGKAFKALIGARYEFRDTWRIPKGGGISADDVQAGTVEARRAIAQAGTADGQAIPTSFEKAKADLKLTPQEEALYQRHLTNLTGPGGVDNPDGSRSTLFQTSFERGGKTYNVPTVWDGKILKPDDAIKRAEREGLDKFPSYGSEDEAEARYGKMHDYMDQDTGRYFAARKANPILGIRPFRNDIGSPDIRRDSFSKFARDGKWVTSQDNTGLNLVYDDTFVRAADGKPLLLTWGDLAARGGSPEARRRTAAHDALSGPQP